MEIIIKTPFLPPFPSHPQKNPSPFLPFPHKPRPETLIKLPARSPILNGDPWTLSDGHAAGSGGPRPKPYRRNPRKPLSDDDARRIIRSKAQYLSLLRRNQGSGAQTPRWIRRTPDQMARIIEDDRNGHLYGRHVVAAVRTVRGLSGRAEGSYNMREVMASFVAKLSFREMCVVLKEQKGWRQARDFFAWMKLQLSYRPSVIVYTILLRIYGQVGKIKLAEEIFLEMLEAGCEPDEVACGTMLCAYARWGRHKDMMLFYSAVRRRDILPSIAVFNFMISSLQKKKLHRKVVELWNHMLVSGMEPNPFTFTIAISSFVKQDLLDDALSTLKEMKKKGFVPQEATYGLLISLTAKNGRGDEALALYEEMRARNIVPSNYTCASLLALYYKNSDYSKALSLFSEMRRNRIVPDEVIYGILVRIYGKLGLYEDAQNTFDDIEKCGLLSNEKTYVAMAQVHMNAGNYEKALEILDLMKSRNVELSKFSHYAFLRCFVAREDVRSAESLFHTLFGNGPPDALCCNDLLKLYIKLGFLKKAKALIAQIRTDGVRFDQDLYRTVVEVYCREGMVADAEHLIEEMERVELNMDKFIKTSLMSMYADAGVLQKAEGLFKTLEQPDATSLSVMLCFYLENCNTHKSYETLKSLLEKEGGLSKASNLITKFAREGDIDKAESIYGQLIELGFRPEDAAITSMITLYGRRQQLSQAKEVYELTSRSSRIGRTVYGSMIDAYCKCGKIDEANHLYDEMIEQGHAPDAVTISILVNALTKSGRYMEAECIIQNSFNGTVELDTIAYNTYIKTMLDSGKLHSAISIYDRMVESSVPPSLQTFNTMISVYGQGGKLDMAVEMFNTAQSSGIPIDEKAYTNMISYYGKSGRSHEASLLFSKMKEDGIRPGKISYNTMINAYAATGLHFEAENLFKDMQRDGHIPDSLSYLALIRAYVMARKYSEAEGIIHRMQEEGTPLTCSHFNLLLSAFTRNSSISDAHRIYCHLKQAGLAPDLPFCRTMMRAYLDHGLVGEGIAFFEAVNGCVRPDGFVLSTAVHLYENAGRESSARGVMDVMNLNGLVFLTNLRIGSRSGD